jgi:hypothetical protein
MGIRTDINKKQEYIRLKWSEKERRIIVEDKDEDRFSLSVEEAIEACKVYERNKQTLFRKQFRTLLDFLGKWAYERRKKLANVFLTIRDAGLLFLVVTKSKIHDEVFEDELTQLDLDIARNKDFSEIFLSVQALPICDKNGYESFCNSEWTLEYTGIDAQ